MNPENLKLSHRIAEKLKQKHQVSFVEIRECFLNRWGSFLKDTRVDHQTEPPTLWFISETDVGRVLKIVFIDLEDGSYEIKTTYPPNTNEVRIYEKFA